MTKNIWNSLNGQLIWPLQTAVFLSVYDFPLLLQYKPKAFSDSQSITEVFYKKAVVKSFAILRGKDLHWTSIEVADL